MKRIVILISVLSIILIANSAFAVVGIGARGGMNMFADDPPGNGPMFGAHLKLDFPLTPISVELSGELFQKTYDEEFAYGGETVEYETKFRNISANATLKYYMKLMPLSPIKPYIGAGAGLHVMSYEVEYEGETIIIPEDAQAGMEPEDVSKLGIHGVLGMDIKLPVMPFALFVEGKYTSVFTEEESTNFTSLYGGINFGF
jgi:outer membrane protein W